MSGTLAQNIIPTYLADVPQVIRIHRLPLNECGLFVQYLRDEHVSICGVSLRVSKDHSDIDSVAFATSTDVFTISLTSTCDSFKPSHGKSSLTPVLSNSICLLAGFAMGRLVLHLYRLFGDHVEGVDLSTLLRVSNTKLQSPADFALRRIHPDLDRHRIHALWYGDGVEDMCLRAWLSAVLAADSFQEVSCALRVRTRLLEDSHLECLSQLILNVELLEAERPTQMNNEFDGVEIDTDGRLAIRNSRFNTRVRRSKQTSIIMETEHGDSIIGHAIRAEGKTTGVKITGGNYRGNIARIRVIGREELTGSELARDEFLLRLLQGVSLPLVQSPFIQMLWFDAAHLKPRAIRPLSVSLGLEHTDFKLNGSQAQVVAAMRSLEEPLVIVHGPPGTGKTTTIAAALYLWEEEYSPAWVIAQSNVGVKNIARTLIKRGIDFKLIVSKEFYVEWHEHLYEELEERLIRSDELISDPVETERKIRGSSVVLCTIAMLSNPAIDDSGVFRFVPMERLVVDEASQIDTFEFMHLFHKFRNLQKICMFGDPKQLPPYGKETAPDIKTIYDFKQFKVAAYFLNTQYRMPTPLGDFISKHVYDSKLRSEHKISDRGAVRLVDVRKGREEQVGSSWKNLEEARTVVNIVKNYYRYLEFCVITPYDAQRAEIVRLLKAEGLPWERVYNVDSFQGHESHYVVISAVRTSAPGFLRSRNRTNVMLTRCERGMVLVSQRAFLRGPGARTLLGELARRWSEPAGARVEGPADWGDYWVDALELSDGRASLPGAPKKTSGVVKSAQATPLRSPVTPGVSPRTPSSSSSSTPSPPLWGPVSPVSPNTPSSPWRPTMPASAQAQGRSQRYVPGSWRTSPGGLDTAKTPSVGTSPSPWTPHVKQLWSASAGNNLPKTWRSPVASSSVNSSPASAPSWRASSEASTVPKWRSSGLHGMAQRGKAGSNAAELDRDRAFPALGTGKPSKPPAVKGRWRSGSDACK